MSTPPAVLRMYTQRDLPVIRPGRHTWEYGRPVVRTPAPAVAVPGAGTYDVDEPRAPTGTGWTVPVPVAVPVDVITDPDEAADHHRTLAGWAHGPHDTLLRLHPKTVAGFRLVRAEK